MQFLKYSLLRLGLFAAVFLLLAWGLRWGVFTAGIVALVIAFAVSYLFFNKLRLQANEDIRKAFSKTSANKTGAQLADEAVEDAYDEQRRRAEGQE